MTEGGDRDSGRVAMVPWRFKLFVFALLSIAPFHLCFDWPESALLGFVAAGLTFFATLAPLFADAERAVRREAARNDPDQLVSLVITVAILVIILFAGAFVLFGRTGEPVLWQKIMLLGTLLVAWLFFNTVFMLHYAHLFYAPQGHGGHRQGIAFPDTPEPAYSDFAYFAFTLGMTFQTSDVEIRSARWRRLVLFQSFAAFVFNIGVIAFTINSLSGN